VDRTFRAGAAFVLVLGLAACNPRFEAGAALQVTAASGGILLQWPAAVDYDEGQTIAEYRIDLNGVEVARVPGTARSCQLTKVPAGTHTVAVTAYDSEAAWSGTVAPDGTLSATVTGPTLDASDAVVGCKGYGATDPAVISNATTAINSTMPANASSADASTCNPGTTTVEYRSAALSKLNAYRTLMGMAPASDDPAFNAQAQASALITAANGSLSHSPTASWTCYSAEGLAGAKTSNISYSGRSSAFTTTVDGIEQYMGSRTHRRSMLCPGTTTVGFGKANGFVSPLHYQGDALKVLPSTGFPAGQSRDGFVAWPSPGVVPLSLLDLGVFLGFTDEYMVTVPAGRSAANAVVTITSSNGNPVTVGGQVHSTVHCASGLDFTPSRQPTAGETWTFTVSGLRNADNSSYTEMWTTTFQSL
jgi:uncharacterized protein YkwD